MEGRIELSLGPDTSLEILQTALHDITETLRMSERIQQIIDRNNAVAAELQSGEYGPLLLETRLWSFPLRFVMDSSRFGAVSSDFDAAVARRLSETLNVPAIRVRQLSYENPLDISFNFTGGGIARILEVIRDWTALRQEARARARIVETRARDYEDAVNFRADLRRAILENLQAAAPISQAQLTELMTEDVIRSLTALIDANPTVAISDETASDG